MDARCLTLAAALLTAAALTADAEQDPKPAADKPPHVFRGTLGPKDPPDPVLKKVPHRVHEVKLEGGQLYQIDLESKDFLPYLRVEDTAGKPLGQDGNSYGRTAVRILGTLKGGTYRFVVSASPRGRPGGDYTLTVGPADERGRQEHLARRLTDAAYMYLERGDFQATEKTLRQALALQRKVLPADHPQLALTLNNLGSALRQQGRKKEALAAIEEALAIRKKVLPDDHPHLASSLDNLATVLMDFGRNEEALRHQEQALAIRKKSLPPDDPDLAAGLNNLGALLRLLGKHDEALRHVEQAVAILRKAPPADRPRLASVLISLGTLLADTGRREEGLAHLEEALAIQRKALSADHPALLDCLARLGEMLYHLGRFEKARHPIEQAAALLRKARPVDHPALVNTLATLGDVLRELGQFEEGRRRLDEALALCAAVLPADHPALAHALNALGALLSESGRREEAHPHLVRALDIRKKLQPPDHVGLGESLNNLGALLRDLGQGREALPYLEQALAAFAKGLPDHHPLVNATRMNLGLALGELGRPREALSHLKSALASLKKTLPEDHPSLATCISNLANLLSAAGQGEEARRHAEQALAIREKALPEDHPDLASSLTNLGKVLQEQGKPKAARSHYERALAILRKGLPEDHPAASVPLTNLGLLLWEAGEHEGGWRNLADATAASARYLRRVAFASARRHHALLVDRWRYQLDILLSAALGEASPPAGRRLELLLRVLDARAFSATALGGRRDALLRDADPKARAVAGELLPLQQRLADLLLRGPGRQPPGEYRKECDDLQRRIDETERDLGLRLRAFALDQQRGRATPEDLAARLAAPGAAGASVLVEAVRYRPYGRPGAGGKLDWGPPRYAALLLWHAGSGPEVRTIDLGSAAPLERAIASWRAAVQAGRSDAEAERALRERLWEPLAKALPAKTARLVIAPDGGLSLVPFEAIKLDNGKYLIEQYAVQYVSTGRDLMLQSLPKERSDVALVLADPDYQRLDGVGAKGAAGFNPAALRAGLSFKSLPGFAREADAVAKLLGGLSDWRVEQARGAEASEEKLAAVKRPRLLHCITHGFFLEDVQREPSRDLLRDLEIVGTGRMRLPNFGADPRLRSGLALAGANKWHERSAKGLSDGLLTALEVENLDLWGTELVVLSACDTGRGEIQVGEGVLGLRRAFQLAGAQTVLASLWKVPDAETEQLITDTLSRWLKGVSPAEALREAQLAMIRRLRASGDAARGQAPPLYWAAFICHGR